MKIDDYEVAKTMRQATHSMWRENLSSSLVDCRDPQREDIGLRSLVACMARLYPRGKAWRGDYAAEENVAAAITILRRNPERLGEVIKPILSVLVDQAQDLFVAFARSHSSHHAILYCVMYENIMSMLGIVQDCGASITLESEMMDQLEGFFDCCIDKLPNAEAQALRSLIVDECDGLNESREHLRSIANAAESGGCCKEAIVKADFLLTKVSILRMLESYDFKGNMDQTVYQGTVLEGWKC